jgi:hypothetical protein
VHAVQLDEPALEYVPLLQFRQMVVPKEYEFAEHLLHAFALRPYPEIQAKQYVEVPLQVKHGDKQAEQLDEEIGE